MRRTICDFAVLGPVLFFSYVAYCSRVNVDRFRPVEMGQAAHAKVSQYVPAVRVVADLGLGTDDPPSDAEIRKAAEVWIHEWRAGVLGDLPQTSHEDSTVDGVKSQIVVARNRLHRALIEASHRARDAGNTTLAAEDLVQAYEVAQILRSSDLAVAASSSAFQIMALRELRMLHASLSADQAARLLDGGPPSESAAKIAKLFLTAVRLYGSDPSNQEKGREETEACYQRLSRIISNEAPSDHARHQIKAMIATMSGENPSLLYAARLAWARLYEVDSYRRECLGLPAGAIAQADGTNSETLAFASR